ncbi:MAG: aryl-sulfate sulfotransferase [Myxococcota bacterium]
MWWLAGCTPDAAVTATVSPSEWVPSSFRVDWTGPAGDAAVWAAEGTFGSWAVVSRATVPEGASSLPLALLAGGRTYRWKVEIDDGRDLWSSAVGQVEVPEPPAAVGDPRVDHQDQGSAATSSGYWVGYHYGRKTQTQDAAPFVWDGDGRAVWWVPPATDGSRAIRVRPSRDRRDVLVLMDHEDPTRRRLERYALDGSSRVVTPLLEATHDFWENPDGTITYVGYHFSDTELVPGQRGPAVADQLVTLPEGGGEPTVGFDFFDDYPVDPWYPCFHANFDEFVPLASEWSHVNSLIRAPTDDGWLLVTRFFDAVVFAGDDGSFGWQAGGIDATVPSTPDAAFRHGHASDAWSEPDGLHLLMFDNGDHGPIPIVSRVVELRITADQVDAVWELPDPNGGYISFLGDAQRLPNGNTLITFTDRGELGEYTPDGDEVRLARVEGQIGRGVWVPELVP